ncbi:MAG: FAD-dependent oxidoreductase [Bryobacteraceae bacterium]
MQTYAVIGAGVFGAWTAYHLRQAGHQVTLLDAYGPGNNRSSSGGETRIIRASYGKDEIYTRMSVRSLALWNAFFARTGRPLLHRTGVLWLGKAGSANLDETRNVLRKAGVAFENLSTSDIERRYPQIRYDACAVFEPDGGALLARQCVQQVAAQFVRDGGTYQQTLVRPPEQTGHLSSITTAAGETVAAGAFIFACGPWLPKMFPDLLGNRILPTRQEVFFFGTPPGDRRFEPPQMPIWIDFEGDCHTYTYGLPAIDGRGFKLAFDRHGPPFDPDTGSRLPSSEQISAARDYLDSHFQALANSPILETRVCQYENTSNSDFILDRHPAFDNVWIAGGGSGHGFKHGPAVGEYVAARVTSSTTPAIEPRFSLASKTTQPNRAVY